jgi:adenine-specific DNA-methyltransferase
MYRNQDQRDFARRLRKEPTPAEKSLWRHLRAQQLRGHKFRRQVAIGPYVVDFACPAARLIVELDGPQHEDPAAQEYDAKRTAWLQSVGYRVQRFRNHRLDDESQAVMDEIAQALEEQTRAASPLPNPPRGRAGGIK